ncbi:MAG: hypothetical protein R3E65_03350 [Steroidobacteraceae bacterium]
MHTLLKSTLFVVLLCTAPLLHAHGDPVPQHGGIIKVSKDITFELVVRPQGASVYLDDHGSPIPTANLVGSLTAVKGLSKSEVELKPTGGNRLDAEGIEIDGGAKVLARIATADGARKFNVWFSVP